MTSSYEVPGLIRLANEETRNQNHEITFLKDMAEARFGPRVWMLQPIFSPLGSAFPELHAIKVTSHPGMSTAVNKVPERHMLPSRHGTFIYWGDPSWAMIWQEQDLDSALSKGHP